MRKARPLALLALLRVGPITVPQLHRFLELRLGRGNPFLPDESTLMKTLLADVRYVRVAQHGNLFTLVPHGRAYLERHPLIVLVFEAFAEAEANEQTEPKTATA